VGRHIGSAAFHDTLVQVERLGTPDADTPEGP